MTDDTLDPLKELERFWGEDLNFVPIVVSYVYIPSLIYYLHPQVVSLVLSYL